MKKEKEWKRERETSWTILTITFFLRSVGHVVRNAPAPYAVTILLSLSLSSLPLLFSLSLVVPFVQFIHCASGVTRARVNRENGRRTEEEGRRKGGGREEGKRKNRPWQQIGITAHVTGCTVTVSVPFSNRIAASLRSRVLTIQQNRTFLLLSLSMFRDFSPGDSVLFPFHKHPRMDLSFSRSCARARVYTRISLERIESI